MPDSDQLWSPLRQGTVPDLIARRILEVIGSDRLRPGDRLPPERELAAMLGTSRPSLREALQSLKARGWVAIRHGSGVYVADPATTRSLREALLAEEVSLRELFEMREVLELPAAAWAAGNGDRGKLAAVQQAFQALMAANPDGTAEAAVRTGRGCRNSTPPSTCASSRRPATASWPGPRACCRRSSPPAWAPRCGCPDGWRSHAASTSAS